MSQAIIQRQRAIARQDRERAHLDALRGERRPGQPLPTPPARKRCGSGLNVGRLLQRRDHVAAQRGTSLGQPPAAPALLTACDRFGRRIPRGFGIMSALARQTPGWQISSSGNTPYRDGSARAASEADALFGRNALALAEGRVSPFKDEP